MGAREEGDQVAELVGGGGEAVEEDDGGCGGGAGGAVEDFYAVGAEGGDLGLGCGHGCGLVGVYGLGEMGLCVVETVLLKIYVFWR